jgi:hypothetical protein
MAITAFGTHRWRRPLRNALLGVGVGAVLVLAALGAVVGLVLLAVGAIAHTLYVALRAPARPAPAAGNSRVIEGEFVVVSGPGRPVRNDVPQAH